GGRELAAVVELARNVGEAICEAVRLIGLALQDARVIDGIVPEHDERAAALAWSDVRRIAAADSDGAAGCGARAEEELSEHGSFGAASSGHRPGDRIGAGAIRCTRDRGCQSGRSEIHNAAARRAADGIALQMERARGTRRGGIRPYHHE